MHWKDNSLAGNSHLFLMLSLKSQILKWAYNWVEVKWYVFFLLNTLTQTSRNPIASFKWKLFFSQHTFPGKQFTIALLWGVHTGRGVLRASPPCAVLMLSDVCDLWQSHLFIPVVQPFPNTPLPFHHTSHSPFFCFSSPKRFCSPKGKYLSVLILYPACKVRAISHLFSCSNAQITTQPWTCIASFLLFYTLTPFAVMHHFYLMAFPALYSQPWPQASCSTTSPRDPAPPL